MTRRSTVIAAVVLAALMVVPSPLLSASDADVTYGDYGAAFGVTMEQIDESVKEIIGKTLTEIINDLLQYVEGYDIKVDPDLHSEFAVRRNTFRAEDNIVVQDTFAGVVVASLLAEAKGQFPDAGHYEAREGEELLDLFKRVFTEEHGQQRDVELYFDVQLYVEGEIVTHVDSKTGELTGMDVMVKFMLKNNEWSDIAITVDEDESGIDISYDGYKESGDGYLRLEATVGAEGLTVMGDKESWECQPKITVHMDALVVSADFAGKVWDLIKSMVDLDDMAKMAIPEIILNIIKSTDRMQDLLQTIESLTSRKIPDMYFTGHCTMNSAVDPYMHSYTQVLIDRVDKYTELRFSPEAFTLDLNMFVNLIPDTILDIETRDIIEAIFSVFGWDEVDVGDIADDPATEEKILETMTFVDERIEDNESFDFQMPLRYLIAGLVIIAGAAGIAFMMWRRRP